MSKIPALTLLLSLLAIRSIEAQACIGLPADRGEFAVRATFEAASGHESYGVAFNANARNPLFAGASSRIDDRGDEAENGLTVAGLLGFELPLPTSSVCLATEPSYSAFDLIASSGASDVEVRTLRFPILVAAGQRLDIVEDGLFLIPAARAGFSYRRVEVGTDAQEEPEPETHTDVVIDAGLTVGHGAAFGRVGFSATTGAQTKPKLTLDVGVRF